MPRPSEKLAEEGAEHFEAQFCTACHGLIAENARSSVPDLRLASAQTHEQIAAIILGGSRRNKGMPSFPHISFEEMKAIQAYILEKGLGRVR